MGDRTVTAALRREGLKAIVFDLDGTLYQDDRLGEEVNRSACRYIASLRGISAAEADALLSEARAAIGTRGTLSRAVTALGGNLKDLHQRFGTEIDPDPILRRDPSVVELLRRLAERFELYLYTNNNRELSARIMDRIGISGLFRAVFTIEDYWRPKPDEIPLLGILETIGRKPAETLFVGDRHQVDLALPETLGCAIFEARTAEELLKLEELMRNNDESRETR